MAKKKKKVYLESDKGNLQKGEADYGVFFGTNDKDTLIQVLGESTFEELNDTVYSGIFYLYEAAVKTFGTKTAREDIHTRAVQMFSLIMDKFYPEGKDTKFGILTDKDIKEAEDRKLDSLSKQK